MKKTEIKKVLHIITGLGDGGAEGVLARLCITSKQVQHVVISLTDKGEYGDIIAGAGIPVYSLGMKSSRPSLLKFFKLIQLIKKESPDIVQTWMYHADLLGGLAARLAGVKRVFWGVRHTTLEQGESTRSTIFVARMCAILSKWIPEKIICCAYKALEVHESIGYISSKFVVIPNGYDLSRFKPDAQKSKKIRNEFNISSADFLIGKVGRYDPQKDHLNLLKALSIALKNGVTFRCFLVGKHLTTDNQDLVDQIEQFGLSDNIFLAGQRNDIESIMNALDLHVLSSSFGEAFPNVVAEAMACGTPCVATNVGDALNILGNPNSCCPVRDPQELANLILNMHKEWIDYPDLWQARKAFGVNRIQANFSIQGMVDSFESHWLLVS